MVSSSTVLWSWVQRGRGRRNPRTQPYPRCHHMIEFHILHVFVTSRAESGHVYVCSRSWWQRYRSCTKTPRTYNCLCAKAVTLSERLDFSDDQWDLLAWLLVVLHETLAGGHNTAVQSRLFHLWCLICPVVDGLLIEAPPQDQGRWRDLEQYFLSWGLSAKNTFTTYSVWWEQCSCTCNSSGPLPQAPNLLHSQGAVTGSGNSSSECTTDYLFWWTNARTSKEKGDNISFLLIWHGHWRWQWFEHWGRSFHYRAMVIYRQI